jgi:serine protease Do
MGVLRNVMVTGALWCASAQAAEMPLEDLVDEVRSAVVLVRTLERTVARGDGIGVVPFSDLGSGVLISDEGDVVTAAHLVQVADVVRVEFADGTAVHAEVVASEPAADLALLKLDRVPAGVTVARLGDSDQVRVGERVFVMGAPYGLSHTLTVGYISARHAPATLSGRFTLGEFFQTDAAINRGNSGGPMFNERGEVIGIVSYIFTRTGAFEGVGFAVTSRTVRELLLSRPFPWSGISVFGLTGALAKALNLPQDTGLLVQRVARGSPGERLGLRPGFLPARLGDQDLLLGGDAILEVDGIPVGDRDTYPELRKHLADLGSGSMLTVKVLRHGAIRDLTMQIE